MKKSFVLLSLCVLCSLSGTLSYEKTNGQRNKELILKNKVRPTDKNFFGLLLVPYIICFFATTGIWPHYPQYMQSSVNEMGQQLFAQSDDHIKNFCRGKFLFNAQAHRPVFFKGIFFPFVPIEEWCPKTTMTTTMFEKTTMKDRPTPAETKETEPATTVPTTTMPPETTTVATTTTPDVSVITFDPNQPTTTICNCNQPKLVNTQASGTVKIEKNVHTTPLPSATTTAPTQPTHIKIDVKNVISFIDLILSYLNVTRTN